MCQGIRPARGSRLGRQRAPCRGADLQKALLVRQAQQVRRRRIQIDDIRTGALDATQRIAGVIDAVGGGEHDQKVEARCA